MSDENAASLQAWLLAGVGAVVGSLVGAVTYLFRKVEFDNAKAIEVLRTENAMLTKRADQCEDDRSELRSEVAVLRVKVDSIEKCVTKIDTDGTAFSHKVLKEKD